MRSGDFSVEVVARGKGVGVRESDSGHVLARPGQVYGLRLRNHGPLRCVADVRIDGRVVTAGGLVIDAGCIEELERPITPDEDGCFTVVAEGDERVFGADGGRDNEALGLIEVRFRRELPDGERPRPLPADRELGGIPEIQTRLSSVRFSLSSRDAVPPNGPHGRFFGRLGQFTSPDLDREDSGSDSALDAPQLEDVERAAGTGLTGHSAQRFRPTTLGTLESEATVIQLRIVIATEEAIRTAPFHRDGPTTPARPLARP